MFFSDGIYKFMGVDVVANSVMLSGIGCLTGALLQLVLGAFLGAVPVFCL